MDLIFAFWDYVLPFLVVLTVLVFVHEMGHYLVARYCGVRVEVFSIGFGPELFGWNDRARTRWRISAIPIGGYVKMYGEQLAPHLPHWEAESEDDRHASFYAKPLRHRAAIVFAGPLANFLFAIIVLAGLYMTIGQPFTPPSIGQVVEGSAAERAGFQPGDIIKRINDTKIERFEDVQFIVQTSAGKRLEIVVERAGRDVTLIAVPDRITETDAFGNEQRIGRLGVSRTRADMVLVRHDPATALWRATGSTFFLVGNIFDGLYEIISGQRGADELGGPLRIAKMSGDAARIGLINAVMFTVILSINLGLINLFPIPMLDGGHLLYYIIEALRGRPLGERAQEYGFRIGLALVLGLMLFATWNDLVQLRVFDFFVKLVT
jgi:regulator of sigma E protease